jgi:hypothetical protein
MGWRIGIIKSCNRCESSLVSVNLSGMFFEPVSDGAQDEKTNKARVFISNHGPMPFEI